MINPFLTSKEPFSVNFTYPADTGRVVDRVLCVQQSPVSCILCPVFFLPRPAPAELFSNTGLNQVNQFAQVTKSIKNNKEMQNKPNLRNDQMNITSVPTETYGELPLRRHPQIKPNSNPIQSHFLC
jgi:hypothetical protein